MYRLYVPCYRCSSIINIKESYDLKSIKKFQFLLNSAPVEYYNIHYNL